MNLSSEPIIVADAETWEGFESNARKEWRKRHKKKSGRKSVANEASKLIIESWLELRVGDMTQYQIRKHAWKKDKSIGESTYKKYTSRFVTLLALADRDQLTENDKKLLEKATPALAQRVNNFKQALGNAITQGEGFTPSYNHKLAEQLAQESRELLASIQAALRKDALSLSLQ
jgi:hypothetical protein